MAELTDQDLEHIRGWLPNLQDRPDLGFEPRKWLTGLLAEHEDLIAIRAELPEIERRLAGIEATERFLANMRGAPSDGR